MTDPTPPSGPTHHTGSFPAVPSPSGPATGMIPAVAAPARPRGATALALTMSMVGTALLMVIVGVIWFGTSGGPAGQRGAWNGPIPFQEGLTDPKSHSVRFAGDVVYFRSTSADDKAWITAVDTRTGAEKWSLKEGLDTGNDFPVVYLEVGRDALLVRTLDSADDGKNHLIEADTGKVHELSESEGAPMNYRMVGGVPVRTAVGGGLEVLDATGENLWEHKESNASPENLVAMATSGDRDDFSSSGNPIDAEQLLSVDYDGTVTILKTTTGEVVEERKEAVASGSTAMLALDDVLYAKTTDGDRNTITAYDIADDFAQLGEWEGEKGQNFSYLTPCGGKRICASGYRSGDSTRLSNTVIDIAEGIVWQAPDDIASTYAYISFAGDTMAVAYLPHHTTDGPTETRLYDKDFEELGEPLTGWFEAVDDKTFASVSSPENRESTPESYDAEVSIIDAADGRVSRLDSYRAYPDCGITATVLACATEPGYRVWTYR